LRVREAKITVGVGVLSQTLAFASENWPIREAERGVEVSPREIPRIIALVCFISGLAVPKHEWWPYRSAKWRGLHVNRACVGELSILVINDGCPAPTIPFGLTTTISHGPEF